MTFREFLDADLLETINFFNKMGVTFDVSGEELEVEQYLETIYIYQKEKAKMVLCDQFSDMIKSERHTVKEIGEMICCSDSFDGEYFYNEEQVVFKCVDGHSHQLHWIKRDFLKMTSNWSDMLEEIPEIDDKTWEFAMMFANMEYLKK